MTYFPYYEWALPSNDDSILDVAANAIIDTYGDLLGAKAIVVMRDSADSSIELVGPRYEDNEGELGRARIKLKIDDPEMFEKAKKFLLANPDITPPQITPDIQELITRLIQIKLFWVTMYFSVAICA